MENSKFLDHLIFQDFKICGFDKFRVGNFRKDGLQHIIYM